MKPPMRWVKRALAAASGRFGAKLRGIRGNRAAPRLILISCAGPRSRDGALVRLQVGCALSPAELARGGDNRRLSIKSRSLVVTPAR